MGDIGQRVGLLRLAQRAARPVGEARGLVERLARDLAHKRLIADLIAEAADHRRDLRVKERAGKNVALDKEDFKILPGRVEDLHRTFVAEEVIDRVQRQVLGQGVDQDRFARLTGKGHLDQAELGIIRPFTQEFGVDGDVGLGLGGFAKAGKVFGRGDRAH